MASATLFSYACLVGERSWSSVAEGASRAAEGEVRVQEM